MLSSYYQLLNFHLNRESFEACFHKSVRPLLIVSAFMIVFTAGLCRIGGFIGCSFIMESRQHGRRLLPVWTRLR